MNTSSNRFRAETASNFAGRETNGSNKSIAEKREEKAYLHSVGSSNPQGYLN